MKYHAQIYCHTSVSLGLTSRDLLLIYRNG